MKFRYSQGGLEMVWRRDPFYDPYYMDNPDSYDEDDDYYSEDGYDGDGYDEDSDEGEETEGASETGDTSQGSSERVNLNCDDNTSTVRSYRRITIHSTKFEEEYATFTLDYFQRSLRRAFKVDQLKAFLTKYNLPKKGRKEDLVCAVANELIRRYKLGNYQSYNEMVKYGEEILIRDPYTYGNVYNLPLPLHLDDKFAREASLKYRFDLELPSGFEIVQTLGDPLYLPLFPLESFRKPFAINFDYKPRSLADSKHYKVVLVVVKIKRITENPAKDSVEYRLSRGSWIHYKYFLNGKEEFSRAKAGLPYVIPVNCETLKSGQNTLKFIARKRVDYYVQLMEIKMEPKKLNLIASEIVKKNFIKAQEQSGVMSTSLQLSLRCPITLVRLVTPIRFGSCKHLQCLDLTSWPNHETENAARYCPLCGKETYGAFIDGFTKEIIEATRETVDSVTIDVDNGCAWRLPTATSSMSASVDSIIDSDATTIGSVEIEPVFIDLYDDETVYDSPWLPPEPVKAAKAAEPVTESVVDLTSETTVQRVVPDKRTGATFEDAIILD